MKLFLVETNQFEYDTYDSAVIACESRAKLIDLINDGVFDKFAADGSKLRDSRDIVSYRTDFFLAHKVETITEIGTYDLPTDKQAVVVHASFNAG